MRIVVVLPAPFGPRNPRFSPFHAKADVVHGGDAAVALGDVLDLDHTSTPFQKLSGWLDKRAVA
jgi:hypothetical protein